MTDRVTRELALDLSVPEAWPVVSDAARLREWLADEVELSLWPGGEAAFVVDGETRSGWVEEVVVPDDERSGRLVFWWQAEGEPASRVVLELVAEGAGSRLRVSETRPLELLDLVGIPVSGAGGAGLTGDRGSGPLASTRALMLA